MTTTELAGPRRCAYNADAPRRAPIVPLRSGHDLIRAAIAKVQKIHDTRDAPAPALLKRPKGRRRKGQVPEQKIVQYLRGERAEAVGVLLALLVDRANWRTGEIGRWRDGELEHRFPVVEYGRDSGLSRDRLERSLSTIGAGGWLWSRQGREFDGDGGHWIGHVAVRKLTQKFWDDIGLGGQRNRLLNETRAEEERQRRIEQRRETRATPQSFDYPYGLTADEYKLFQRESMQVAAERVAMNLSLEEDDVNAEALQRIGKAPPGGRA
jgi:hypothetical protein